jgi:hypothetical protein
MPSPLASALVKFKKRRSVSSSGLTAAKAREMLRDGTAHGKDLTPAQRRLFYHVAGHSKW